MASIVQSVPDIESSNSRDDADQLGNTSLHRAAADRNAEAFTSKYKEFPMLASARNIHGETPIFSAARRGSKKFFSKVTSVLPADTIDITMLRRNDGETILHYALTAEYFDLASDIIERFSQLVYCRNSRGLTPIHILASNPSAFESGCEFGSFSSLLYSHLKVSPLLGDYAVHYPSLSDCLSHWLEFFKEWIGFFANAECDILHINTQTSAQCVKDLFYGFLQLAFVCILIVPILASPVVLILAWPVILAIFGHNEATLKKLKKKHEWANEVTKKILGKIEKWQDFSEINSGMNPYKYQVEWSIKQLQLQGDEKEIPSAFETNSIQKSQQIPGTVSTKGIN